MKYEWYIKDRNGSWTKTGSTTNKYSVSITKARNGRQVFCKVIDKSGKYAKSRIVTAKIKQILINQGADFNNEIGSIFILRVVCYLAVSHRVKNAGKKTAA